MSSTPARLMTFAEFEQLPDPPGGARYELHNGELVTVAPPGSRHLVLQLNIRESLRSAPTGSGFVLTEFPCRPHPEFESIVLDVAYLTIEQWDQFRRAEYFHGAPAIGVEVLSPSNTPQRIAHKRELCLRSGSRAFWIADDDRREVDVYTASGLVTYTSGQHVPLFLGGTISVDEIFR